MQEAEKGIQWVAELGLEGVCLELGDDTNDYLLSQQEVQKQFDEWRHRWGITYSSLGIGVLCKYGMSVSSHQKMAKTAIRKAIEAAFSLKIPVIQLHSFANGAINSSEDLRNTMECFRYACKYAEGTDIFVASENLLSADEQIKMIEEVGFPNFKICFDTRNPFSMKGYDVPSFLEKLFPYVYEVHLKDGIDNGNCTELGQGNSSFLRSLEVLRQYSYTGWLLLENDCQAMSRENGVVVENIVRKDMDVVRSFCAMI